jgi:hypothetical protein
MEFRIADTFTAALSRLTRDEQKAVKNSVFDLQINPTMQGLQLHRIDASKDRNFWSFGSTVTFASSFPRRPQVCCWPMSITMTMHKWAERRRIETHPKTGAVQIVVRERVEEIARAPFYARDCSRRA